MDIDRKITSEIQDRMDLDAGLGRSKFSPWTEIYRTSIKGIDRIVNIEPRWIFRIQRTDSLDKNLSKVTVQVEYKKNICY